MHMKRNIVVFLTILLTGCSTREAEIKYFSNGNLYAVGDPNCANTRFAMGDEIQCMTSDYTPTETRKPIPPEQALAIVRMKREAQEIEARQLAQFNASMPVFNGTITAPQYNYIAPAVMPIVSPASNQIRCITAGIYTNCRY